MAKARWSRESAISYLAGNPNFQFAKPSDTYTDAYLKRVASKYQDAERAGKEITREQARGHARAPIAHEDRDKGKGILERFSMTPHAKGDGTMTTDDLVRLCQRAGKKSPNDEILLVVHGVPDRGSRDPDFVPGKEVSYSYWTTRAVVDGYIEENGKEADVKQFVNELTGLEWEELYSLAIALPSGGEQE